MRHWLETARLLGVLAFYLFCNLYIFLLPVAVYYSWQGNFVMRALALVTLVDYCWPLRPGPKGMWLLWCKITDYNAGLASYFSTELVMEVCNSLATYRGGRYGRAVGPGGTAATRIGIGNGPVAAKHARH